MPFPEFSQIPPPDPVLQTLHRLEEKLLEMELCLRGHDAVLVEIVRKLDVLTSDAMVRHLAE